MKIKKKLNYLKIISLNLLLIMQKNEYQPNLKKRFIVQILKGKDLIHLLYLHIFFELQE